MKSKTHLLTINKKNRNSEEKNANSEIDIFFNEFQNKHGSI